MRRHLLGIDHVVVVVNALDAAADAFRRMGFTVTPRGHHTLGSSNHCIMLGPDYIELLYSPPDNAHPSRAYYTEFAAGGDGLAGIAVATDSAKGLYGELLWAGFNPSDPVEFSRPVDLPGGTQDAKFRITQVDPAKTPGAKLFACEHLTRDVVWRPEWQRHANGARALAAVAIRTDDAEETAQSYARLFDNEPLVIPEGRLVQTGTAPLAFMNAAAFAARLPDVRLPRRPPPVAAALFVHVADRDVAEQVLRDGGLAPRRLPDGAIAIGADRAHGTALVFG
jgi:hypothetical protein